jgi:hypothetical protein
MRIALIHGKALPVTRGGPVFEGALIAESLRTGTTLPDLHLIVRKITRHSRYDAAPGQPRTWTEIEFEVDDEDAETLADSLAEALEEGPGWYADLRSAAETVVVFPGKIFRYPRGEDAGRARAVGHGRHLGIPEIQLDWPM